MKKIIFTLIALVLCLATAMQAKDEKKEEAANSPSKQLRVVPQVYAYSVGTTVTDSVVYMTDVLILKNAQVTKKTNFLVGRQDYSSQFKNYLAGLNLTDRTCATMYNLNHRKAFKEYEKLKKSLMKRGFTIKVIDQTEFRYIVTQN